MRALIQRVTKASVEVDGAVVAEISAGMLLLLGIGHSDSVRDADYLLNKIVNLRIFEDSDGKMNLSLRETNGQVLIVSQFTLYGECSQGRRPSFDRAARPETARVLYDYFVTQAHSTGVTVQSGIFQASMLVSLVNDGPVTFLCESAV